MKKQKLWKTSIASFLTAALLCIVPSVAASDSDGNPFFKKISEGNCQSGDIDEALLLANQDDIAAQSFLGVAYLDGLCGQQYNATEGLRWLRRAAEQGNDASAQYTVGWMYEDGYGVEQDDAQALRWYRLAAEQGHEEAQVALSRLSSAPK